ncbi:MAG: uridylate kinase [Chloroflexi bacterium]|nr:uridylate kinase [Chloroflexota bacterium]
MSELVFLKLGGSLITDKARPYTPRLDKLTDLASQIAAARRADPGLLLLLGHGSGSFGHVPAKKYRTREGISPPPRSPEGEGRYWRGFAEVWFQASALNRFVMAALRAAAIPALALPPSASVTAREGAVAAWDLAPLRAALEAGLLPVVYGDAVFDQALGGTILSTEDLFAYLAREMRPARILLAGLEDGVYADFPARTRRLGTITPRSFDEIRSGVGAAAGTDVTGGMDSKVRQMLELVEKVPNLSVQLFSGAESGRLLRALQGEKLGTLIRPDK